MTPQKKSEKRYAEVVVDMPVEGPFSYAIPDELASQVAAGVRVLVPFGRRTVTGYVVGMADKAGVRDVKRVIDVLDPAPIFDDKRLAFYRWLSSYYFAPLGTVLALIHPGGANIRSLRKITLTGAGTRALAEGEKTTSLERDILAAAGKGVTVSTLAKRLKGPVNSTIERLKKNGLLAEETLLRGGHSIKTEKFISLARPGPEDPGRVFKNAPVQARVYGHIRQNGTISLSELNRTFGAAGAVTKKLADKGFIEVSVRQVFRDPLSDLKPRSANFKPNAEQTSAIDAITASFTKGFSPFLLYGVTGSGKTLVYLNILEDIVARGKKAVILSPEIALTPWPAAYLAEMFPGRVALAHSGLTDGERYDEWRRVVSGDVDIVVGARSALFSPIRDLGLIIVDEEHETSYKQEDGVRYNARDSAIMLAQHLGITVVLGSATPSVETFHNALSGKITPIHLKKRVLGQKMPEVELVDMKGLKGTVFSETLATALKKNLEDGHQSLLFLNRRGFSSFLICKDCGHTPSCLNCSVTLTMHKAKGILKCHYCDMSTPVPAECPGCGGVNLHSPGIGTEKVEEEVHGLLPGARVARMDRDTTRIRGSARKIIEAVEGKEVDVLIGTQMVSKGHHFPGITLVGVISGDTSLNIPDFRSAERTFQLLTQAAGRAGRDEAPGKVLIQTLNPGHYCLKNAVTHDYEGFYAEEIALREEVNYPPFVRLCCLRVDGPTEVLAEKAAGMLKLRAERLALRAGPGIALLGPAPALLTKLKGRFRWNLLVKGQDLKTMHSFLKALKRSFDDSRPPRVNLSVDMDPISVI